MSSAFGRPAKCNRSLKVLLKVYFTQSTFKGLRLTTVLQRNFSSLKPLRRSSVLEGLVHGLLIQEYIFKGY